MKTRVSFTLVRVYLYSFSFFLQVVFEKVLFVGNKLFLPIDGLAMLQGKSGYSSATSFSANLFEYV